MPELYRRIRRKRMGTAERIDGAEEGSRDEYGEQRRVLISYLRRKEGKTASFVELIHHLAFRGSDSDKQTTVEDVAVSLYYLHLPALADAELVEYDRRSRTVQYRGDTSVSG